MQITTPERHRVLGYSSILNDVYYASEVKGVSWINGNVGPRKYTLNESDLCSNEQYFRSSENNSSLYLFLLSYRNDNFFIIELSLLFLY